MITDDMRIILNFFEVIASSASNGVADEDMLKTSFAGTMRHWLNILSEFRLHTVASRGYDPWLPMTILEQRWGTVIPTAKAPLGTP